MSDAHPDSPRGVFAQVLVEFLQSDEGRALIRRALATPLPDRGGV